MILSAEAEEDALFGDTAKIYISAAEMTTDGFDADGVAFLRAQSIFSQNPKVGQIVIGKRATLPTMILDMIPIAQNDTDYVVTIGGRGAGVPETFTFTSDATATEAEIIIGLVALINGGAQDVLAVDVGPGTSMTIETAATPGGASAPGKPFTIVFDRALWTVQNDTPDPGVVADLTAVRTAFDGNDDWYALHLDSYGAAEINSLAVNIETIRRIFLAATSDADGLTAVDTDIFSVLQALSLARTALIWHENPHLGADSAWGGKVLPSDPGSVTWKFKTLVGIAASSLTTAEENFLKAKGGNRYLTIAGVSITCDGVMIGGEFIDITRGIDFITARLEENIFGALAKALKIPFTDDGIAIIENEVRGVLQLGVGQGIFTNDPPFTVTVPTAVSVDDTDKANRLLPDVNFTAVLAGAIHEVEVNGTVTV
jgi:hypothetical protein